MTKVPGGRLEVGVSGSQITETVIRVDEACVEKVIFDLEYQVGPNRQRDCRVTALVETVFGDTVGLAVSTNGTESRVQGVGKGHGKGAH